MRIPISDYAFIDLDAPTVAACETICAVTGAVTWNVWCRYFELWREHGPAGRTPRRSQQNVHALLQDEHNLAYAGEWWTLFTIPPFHAAWMKPIGNEGGQNLRVDFLLKPLIQYLRITRLAFLA